MPSRPKPVVLCILDGFGARAEREHNAIAQAMTPCLDQLFATCPHSLLETSGLSVGLPEGQMGNSEVGHMTIGGGRVSMQSLPRIDQAIKSGELVSRPRNDLNDELRGRKDTSHSNECHVYPGNDESHFRDMTLAKNPALQKLIAALKESGGACHLMGLLSDGGVHAHIAHIEALAGVVTGAGVPVWLHVFTDGRDTPPNSALEFVKRFRPGGAKIASLMGRYWAMDRDRRWERVSRAYAAIVDAKGARAGNAVSAIEASYAANVTDEFIAPAVMPGYLGVKDGDGLLMANFRADRARQILAALLDPAFADFPRGQAVKFAAAAGMVEYSDTLNPFLPAMFPAEQPSATLGEIVAKAGLKQLRIAETEKYAHVTFFFNGGQELAFPGEDRILVPSPKVATYDMQPEMAAGEVTEKLVRAIDSGVYDFIVVNYANTDMVGHTGSMDAAMRAVEAVDAGIGRVADSVRKQGGVLLITADHGNAELMVDPETGGPHTAHTTLPVPLIVMGAGNVKLNNGGLAGIAPTLLEIMRLPKPVEMTGKSLLTD